MVGEQLFHFRQVLACRLARPSHRTGLRRQRQPEAAESRPRELQLNRPFGPARKAGETTFDRQQRGVVFAGVGVRAPSCARVVVDRQGELLLRLLERRLHRLQLQHHGRLLVVGIERLGGDLQVPERKAAVAAQTGPLSRQRLVREGVEPHTGDRALEGVRDKLVRVAVLSSRIIHGDDAVVQRHQSGVPRRHLSNVQRLPTRLASELGQFRLPPLFDSGRQLALREFVDRRLPLRQLGGVFSPLPLGRRRVRVERHVAVRGLREIRGERVIILVRERIIFVLVAANAAERQSEHRAADRHHHVVELVVANPLNGLRGDLSRIRSGDEKSGGRSPFVARYQLVAGELHSQELVVRHVGVQGANHPVSIVVGSRPKPIELVAAALRESSRIEPMASPTLAVVRASEQFIDHLFPSLGRRVREERVELFAGRR